LDIVLFGKAQVGMHVRASKYHKMLQAIIPGVDVSSLVKQHGVESLGGGLARLEQGQVVA
jgi:hypothetical protein